MANQWKKVLVTVGTTRFDKLMDQILDNNTLRVLSDMGCVELTIQFGSTKLKPIDSNEFNINIKTFDYKNSICEDIRSADLVIGHAGQSGHTYGHICAGTTLEVLRAHKPLLVVINEDLMDNHQKELADRLQTDSYLLHCFPNTLVQTLNRFDAKLLKPFPEPKPQIFADFIDNIFFNQKLNKT